MRRFSVSSDFARSRAGARLAAAAMAVALGAATAAQATDFFTATGVPPGAVSIVPIGSLGGFTFGFYHVQVGGGCGGCLTETTPGAAAGTFSFGLVSAPFNFITDPPISSDPAENNHSAVPVGSSAPGVYVEHFGGFGDVNIGSGGSEASSDLLGGANNFEGFSIYAAPGSSSATYEFDLDGFATSSLLTLPSGPLYLDITGTTASPVALTDLTPGQSPDFLTFTEPMKVDFTLTLTDTPFSPGAAIGGGPGPGPGLPGVPEPASWVLMLAGFGATGLMLRRRRDTGAATA